MMGAVALSCFRTSSSSAMLLFSADTDGFLYKEVDACGIILYRRYLRAHTQSRTTLRFILLDGGDLLHTVCVVEPGVPVDINANFGR